MQALQRAVKRQVKQQYLPHIFPQYGELRPTSGLDRFVSLGAPQLISTGFAFWLRYCSDVAQRKSTKLCLVRHIYTFGISCPLTEFCHVQNSLCVHLRTIAQVPRAISTQLRHLSTIGKSVLNSNMSYRCPHDMVNFSQLTAEIGSRVWGTPGKFNGFRVLAALLHGSKVVSVSQTLRR